MTLHLAPPPGVIPSRLAAASQGRRTHQKWVEPPAVLTPAFFAQHSVVDPVTGCWQWVGSPVTPGGGARIRVNGRTEWVHRIALAVQLGHALPAGTFARRTCGTGNCVSPSHLYAASSKRGLTAIERLPPRLLTPAEVAAIRGSDDTLDVLAARYAVSVKVMQGVLTGESYPDRTYVPRLQAVRHSKDLRVDEVRAIRASRGAPAAIAARFGVSVRVVWGVLRGTLHPDRTYQPRGRWAKAPAAPRGKPRPRRKLTLDDVAAIRAMPPDVSIVEIAEMYAVTVVYVRAILRGKYYPDADYVPKLRKLRPDNPEPMADQMPSQEAA